MSESQFLDAREAAFKSYSSKTRELYHFMHNMMGGPTLTPLEDFRIPARYAQTIRRTLHQAEAEPVVRSHLGVRRIVLARGSQLRESRPMVALGDSLEGSLEDDLRTTDCLVRAHASTPGTPLSARTGFGLSAICTESIPRGRNRAATARETRGAHRAGPSTRSGRV